MAIKKLKLISAQIAGGVFSGLSLTSSAHADSGESIITDNIVDITKTTSPADFKHAGIRFTKEFLETLRRLCVGMTPILQGRILYPPRAGYWSACFHR